MSYLDSRKMTLADLKPYFKLLAETLRENYMDLLITDDIKDLIKAIYLVCNAMDNDGTKLIKTFPSVGNFDYFVCLFLKDALDIDSFADPETALQIQTLARALPENSMFDNTIIVYEGATIKLSQSFINKHKDTNFILENKTTVVFEEGITTLNYAGKNKLFRLMRPEERSPFPNVKIILPSTLKGRIYVSSLFNYEAYQGGGDINFIVTPVKNKEGKDVSPFEISPSEVREVGYKGNMHFYFYFA